MFSSLARGLGRRGHAHTPASNPPQHGPHRVPYFQRYEDDEEAIRRHSESMPSTGSPEDTEQDDNIAENEANEADPLLPIFSAAHLGMCTDIAVWRSTDERLLDSLPIFDLTHNIRLLIVQKCETTLSWDQLRSPQVSQFLVKPIQNDVRSSHFSRATLYALIANCLQFRKEGEANPGIVGVCNTRALLSELLAVRLLKDFTTRELIDALSYDFDPLSGVRTEVNGAADRGRPTKAQPRKKPSALARTSTLEVAIRAQAKKFLSHPAVVQHLEAIWAGTIVFHSAADNLHRYPARPRLNHDRQYGAMHNPRLQGPSPSTHQSSTPSPAAPAETIRRSVSLYDPSKASLFKLSRLRVPRYRQLFSTLSYFVMLCLFIAVLSQRSLPVTALEVLFWFWSAGFMLDELIEFSEQGFGLYIASVWSAFDIGILIMFSLYYILRISGAVVNEAYKQRMAFMAYDVLAASAVLLFPRLFSLLDHYRYFSQLLIAFRLMAQDLAAVLFLIGITCSGFFVTFTMSFGQEDFDGHGVAYALFQILMGFTPAVWGVWDEVNVLGKMIMTLFLIICHFLVVTILITVLTNSFMAIVKNAHEEHQFLFAVNTISSVKSDALFSYVAPTNCLGFMLTPLRYFMPFPKFVIVNRTVIKATHFPMLFAIFLYERLRLAGSGTEPVEHIEQRGRSLQRVPTFAMGGGIDAFTNTQRLRMPSEATWQKDRALDEVFRRPFNADSAVRKPRQSEERRNTAVDRWMNVVGDQGGASPPPEQSESILEQLEKGRPGLFRSKTSSRLMRTRSMANSFNSLPDDHHSSSHPGRIQKMEDSEIIGMSIDEPVEADDELNSNDDQHEQADALHHGPDKERLLNARVRPRAPSIRFRDTTTPSSGSRTQRPGASPQPVSSSPTAFRPNARRHNREPSTQTIVFSPLPDDSSVSSPPRSPTKFGHRWHKRPVTALKTIPSASHSPPVEISGSQPKHPERQQRLGVPHLRGTVNNSTPALVPALRSALSGNHTRYPSYDVGALDLASDIGDNHHHDPAAGLLSSSFHTQIMRGIELSKRRHEAEDNGTMNRIILTRMNSLEEGFKDILKEVKELRSTSNRGASSGENSTTAVQSPKRTTKKKQRNKNKSTKNKEQLPPQQEDPVEDVSRDVTPIVVHHGQ